MATHGCLQIIATDESHGKRSRHTLLMHTYHSGYLIPEAVLAVTKLCARKYSYMIDIARDNHNETPCGDESDAIDSHVQSMMPKPPAFSVDYVFGWYKSGMCGISSLYWPTSLAALISAAMPGLLETTPYPYTKYLPTWSGLNTPYRLIVNNGGEWGWKLYGEKWDVGVDEDDEEGSGKLLFACNPEDLIARELAVMYYGGLGAKQWPDGCLT